MCLMLLRLYTTSRPVQHSYWFFLGMLIPVVYLLGKIARLGLSKTSGGRIMDFFVSLWNGFMVWPASFRYLVLAVIVLLFFAKIWGNQFLGKSGEHWAAQELGKLPSGEYHVLNDLVLEDSHGLHQIDHVVVSPYGIYMVETKNYTGQHNRRCKICELAAIRRWAEASASLIRRYGKIMVTFNACKNCLSLTNRHLCQSYALPTEPKPKSQCIPTANS